MPIDEKQKEALKEKYKEHRRAVWRGETSNSKKDSENIDVLYDFEQESEKSSQEGENSESVKEDDKATIVEIEPEYVTEDSSDSDLEDTVFDDYTVIEPETTELDSEVDQDDSNDVVQAELIEKIKEQRRTTWAGESPSKVQFKEKENSKIAKVEKKSNSESFSHSPNEEKDGITWKTAVAVIIGITGAIGVGVYLGYIIASYL